ncbi:MAG: dTMP kinase [Bdellovibrio sp. CG10_big_fil_rev_8_21_14_0_10_47_8]|nr:MAG: dTMP kinase [Bdellovibrio sp. CG10_big_fil_rev_8_21_14_0_10_47_8]
MPFVVFEGLDGSGKSSLMTAFESELKTKGLEAVRTREPGGTPLGDQIREMILSTDGPAPTARTELLLYEASRAQHVDMVIRPALKKQQWVLCDRFSASSIAFQAGGRAISENWVEQLNQFATDGLKPELTVLLDLSVDESRRRRNSRQAAGGGQEDRIESEADSFHQRVRKSFLDQAQRDPKHWLVLDAAETPEQLLTRLLTHIRGLQWLSF